MDLYGNGLLANSRQIQSEYYNSIQYALLAFVWSCRDMSIWYLVEVNIKRVSEVTIDVDMLFESPNQK